MNNLHTLSIKEARDGLDSKKFSSVELTKTCLERTKTVEPKINAYVTVTEEAALRMAKKADELLKNGDLNPLLGIPVGVKDNYCTKDIRTTAASKVLDNFIPPYDASVWDRVKQQGAVLVGKTNMDAWAHGSSTETSDYGATKNPWDTTKLPGGSSGGSGATVAADEVIYSLGSETAGSIRQPASWCGIVGFKPTYGRTSRYGIIAMGSSLDCPGPMTKTVEDSAIVMNSIAGNDPHDATSSEKNVPDYTSYLGKSIRGMKIGYSNDYFEGVDSGVVETVKKAMNKLEELGATIIEVKLFEPKYAIAVYTIIQRSEVSSNLARYDGIRYGDGRDRFEEEAKRRIMLGTYALSSGYYDAYYLKAEKVRTVIINDFNTAFEKVDLIVGPTSPSTALPVGSSKDHPMFGEMADVLVEPSSIAGLPGINVPCGFSKGLPVGLQFIGPQFREGLVFTAGYAYEQVTEWHKRKPDLQSLNK